MDGSAINHFYYLLTVILGDYRIEINGNIANLVTPDFKKILKLNLPFFEEFTGLLSAKIKKAKNEITIERYGQGKFKYST